jgi:glutaminase
MNELGAVSTMAAVSAMAAGTESPVRVYLMDVYERCVADRSGAVADYIPELARVDPEGFGICVATVDGQVYEVGDTRVGYTIQSMSKPFVYGLALADRGSDCIAAKIGVEPSGEAFNEISLCPITGRPRNPMINAGAITATSLVDAADAAEGFERIRAMLSGYAGRELSVDEAVSASEHDTGHRNRAIGHMLRNFDVLEDDPERALGVYFRQCAVTVDCRDMAMMAVTLANGGRNPVSGERMLPDALVPRVLSVMTTCGMYDGSGRWVDAVGLPAKSGVGGGIIAVLPGQLAISVYSPRLDAEGNSVRGVRVCRALAHELDLHSLRVTRAARSTIRAVHDLAAVPSRRHRPPHETAALADRAAQAYVIELQGDVAFAGAERIARWCDHHEDLAAAIFDLRQVDRLSSSAARILIDLAHALESAGCLVALVPGRISVGGEMDGLQSFSDVDRASEWAEERLLNEAGLAAVDADEIAPPAHRLCQGLTPGELERVSELLSERRFGPGETLIEIGEPAVELMLLLAGVVDVTLPLSGGRTRRLASLGPGDTIGELAILGESVRTARVTATTNGRVAALSARDFAELGDTDPHLQSRLLRNMLVRSHEIVGRLNGEIAALSADS